MNTKFDTLTEQHASSSEAQQGPFQEILAPEGRDKGTQGQSSYLNAYIARVQPKECGPLVKKLGKKASGATQQSSLSLLSDPRTDLGHLRRVRRRQNDDALNVQTTTTTTISDTPEKNNSSNNNNNNNQKEQPKAKNNIELHVLLGAVADVDKFCRANQIPDALDYFRQEYGIHSNNIVIESIPARMAESVHELQSFNATWPTLYYPKKTWEHKRRERCLTPQELEQMTTGMQSALNDALGAIMLDPQSGNVVSRAQEEQDKQQAMGYSCTSGGGVTPLINSNPLATPILYAIQGVSRREREMACSVGMDNPVFQKGQYLCTGFDCYTIREPSVFEAMSLVHSRIRRVIFGVAPVEQGGISQYNVHCLPNTNHNFRAFVCQADSELGKQCAERLIIKE